MSGSVTGHMFTIEQIELIRRLRNSGITKEQVIQAFDSYDRINQELGQLYNIPVTQMVQNGPHNSQNHARYSQSQSHSQSPVQVSAQQAAYASHQRVQQYVHPGTAQRQQQMTLQSKGEQGVPLQRQQQPLASQNKVGQSVGAQRVLNTSPHSSSNPVFPVAITANPHTVVNQYQERQGVKRPHIETIDLDEEDSSGSQDNEGNHGSNTLSSSHLSDDAEVRDFLRQGNEKVTEEVRKFVGTHDIRQADIASMTGQSLAIVDQFLQGDIREVPAQAVKDICTWYLSYNKAVNMNNINFPVLGQKIKIAGGQEIIIPHQRRERFTFREKHLEVLESCFSENSYPSQEQRDVIAQMCNAAISNMGARILHDREKVTPHMVLNWFANRRKEVKRIAREEGIPESEVVLPSKIVKKDNYTFDMTFDDVQLSPIAVTEGETVDNTAGTAAVKQEPD